MSTPQPIHVYYQTWLNDAGIIVGIIVGLIAIGGTYIAYTREQARRKDITHTAVIQRFSWHTKARLFRKRRK